jgi:hypothetical protein
LRELWGNNDILYEINNEIIKDIDFSDEDRDNAEKI